MFGSKIMNYIKLEPHRISFHQIKNHCIILSETFMLICMQTFNFITHLIWVICARLATHTVYVKNDNINWNKPLTFICKQKINFILHVLPEILQRYSNFVILGALGMPGNGHAKLFWYYQLVENVRVYFGRDSPRTNKMIVSFCRKLDVYLHAKNNLIIHF